MGCVWAGLALLNLSNHTPMRWLWPAGSALVFLVALSTYTTLSDGRLTVRYLFFRIRQIPLDEITLIAPHPKSGHPGYGTLIDIYANTQKKKVTFSPEKPEVFLEALHREVPRAGYLF